MEDKRFDALTKALARGASRRSVFKGLLGLGGAAIVGGAVLEGDGEVEAARRTPVPTPTPKCPGIQVWDPGSKTCICPPKSPAWVQCVPGGPTCCNENVPVGPGYSECCDNACCQYPYDCVAEEQCCLRLPDVGCVDDRGRCCTTLCEVTPLGVDCCPSDEFCPGGSTSADLCCNGDTPIKCACGTNGNICLPDTDEACCVAADCDTPPAGSSQCVTATCDEHVCHYHDCAEGSICCPDNNGVNACRAGGDECCLRDEQCADTCEICKNFICVDDPAKFPCGDGCCVNADTCCDDKCCAGQCLRDNDPEYCCTTGLTCPITEGPDECCLDPAQDKCCGEDGCCRGQCYGEGDNRCCPKADGFICNGICCKNENTCCGIGTDSETCCSPGQCNANTGVCCPIGTFPCGESCCANADTCCDGACCAGPCISPPREALDGDEICCPSADHFVCNSNECCANADNCCKVDGCCDGQCNNLGQCCPDDTSFVCNGECCPDANDCCGDGDTATCCARGQCNKSTGVCCETGFEPCGKLCIPNDKTCCDSDDDCPEGCHYCDEGLGYCVSGCEPGRYCCTRTSGGVSESHCIAESECCRNNQCEDDLENCIVGICDRDGGFSGTCTTRSQCRGATPQCCPGDPRGTCIAATGCCDDIDCTGECQICDTASHTCVTDPDCCLGGCGNCGMCEAGRCVKDNNALCPGNACATCLQDATGGQWNCQSCPAGDTCKSCDDDFQCCYGDKPNCCTDECVTGDECCVASDCTTWPDACFTATCDDGACKYTDTCTSGTCCSDGTCTGDPGIECCGNDDCGDCQLCDSATHTCQADPNCACDPECEGNFVCQGGVCVCPSPYELCLGIFCVECCVDDSNCVNFGPPWDTECVRCRVSDGTCQPNNENGECEVGPGDDADNGYCSGGVCLPCLADTLACTVDNQCCSDDCIGVGSGQRRCTCSANGDICNDNADCCDGGSCISNVCQAACTPDNNACIYDPSDEDGTCCTGSCCNLPENKCKKNPGGGGSGHIGDSCNGDGNCCSHCCFNGFCAAPSACEQPLVKPADVESVETVECTPKDLCLDTECGTIDDGCGGTIDCGCPDGSSCDATGQCVADCVPTACDGVTCGLIEDGCGGTIDCDCADGSVCNGNTCCTPEACAEGYCGLAEDGCGGTQNCTCPDDGSVCYNNQCCTPKTCADLEAGKCGLAEDGCGGTINCPC